MRSLAEKTRIKVAIVISMAMLFAENCVFAAAPTVQATNVAITGIGNNSMSVTWTRGNGARCAVFVNDNFQGYYTPTNGVSYTANSVWPNGSRIGSTGWYCVYSGTGTSATFTGLSTASLYYVAIFEYNEGPIEYCTIINTNRAQDVTTPSTTWNGNAWSGGAPTTLTAAVITGSYSISTSITCRALYNKNVINLQPGRTLTVTNEFFNEGFLFLNAPYSSGAAASFIGFCKGSYIETNRFFTQGSTELTDYNWHSFTPPLYIPHVETYFEHDWVYEYIESTNSWKALYYGVHDMDMGKGYIVKTIVDGGKNVNLQGVATVSQQSFSLTNTGGDATHGYNFVGNPFLSAVDWNAASGWTRTNIDGTFWIWNPATNNYSSWNGTVGTNGGTRYIPSLQGFFVKVSTGQTSGTLIMTSATQVHSSQAFKSGTLEPAIIRMKVTGNSFEDDIVVYKDNGENDAIKFFSMNPAVPQIYVTNENKNYSIFKLSPQNKNDSITLGFKCNKSGTYNLSVPEFTINNTKVELLDLKTNKLSELSPSSVVAFDYTKDDANPRFKLYVKSTDNATIAKTLTAEKLAVWSNGHNIFVQVSESSPTIVEVYNMQGTKVTETLFKNSGINTLRLGMAGGFIVVAKQNNSVVSRKIVIAD